MKGGPTGTRSAERSSRANQQAARCMLHRGAEVRKPPRRRQEASASATSSHTRGTCSMARRRCSATPIADTSPDWARGPDAVAQQPPPLRPLHRRPLEAARELRLVRPYPLDQRRPIHPVPREERRLLGRRREPVPGAHLLAGFPTSALCDPARDGAPNAVLRTEIAAGVSGPDPPCDRWTFPSVAQRDPVPTSLVR
jgi:hypothetical protein